MVCAFHAKCWFIYYLLFIVGFLDFLIKNVHNPWHMGCQGNKSWKGQIMDKTKIDLSTINDTNNPGITKCPYCGHNEFYIKMRYSGTGFFYHSFDGKPAENSGMYDCITSSTVGKFAYCPKCGKKVFRIKK